MEMVLDLYEQPYDPKRPVVCLDERPGQLLSEVYQPTALAPGKARRQDFEYKREGTFNIFMMVEPLRGWRLANVTQQRTAMDFANQLGQLEKEYPDADEIVLVSDNLNTHKLENLWKVFEPAEALRLSKRFRMVHTPKHGSWLNMAEIELSAMDKQCLGRTRYETCEAVSARVEPWNKARNEQRVKIRWSFTVEKARDKFQRHYRSELS